MNLPPAARSAPAEASASGRFRDEIVAVTVKGRKGDTVVDTDEYIRPEHGHGRANQITAGVSEGRDGDGGQCERH